MCNCQELYSCWDGFKSNRNVFCSLVHLEETMHMKPKILRWGLIIGYFGIITSLLACMTIGLGTSKTDSGTLQIDNGSVEVKGLNGEWRPVAGASTFELVGALKSMSPWVVAGTTLETNETTKIAEGLQVGDL